MTRAINGAKFATRETVTVEVIYKTGGANSKDIPMPVEVEYIREPYRYNSKRVSIMGCKGLEGIKVSGKMLKRLERELKAAIGDVSGFNYLRENIQVLTLRRGRI